jgi:uncharacterized protein
MGLQLRRTDLNRQTRFSFSCSRCLCCCRHKKIQVNPYEIARLAGNRQMSTADFVARFTHAGGTILNWNDDGTCVFLDADGCSVHPDRPLVCRLYPLGRHVFGSGEEGFSEVEPDPDCKGVYGEEEKIAGFLESQGALLFMEAADRYLGLFWRLYQIVQEKAEEPAERDAVIDVFQRFSEGFRAGDRILTDVDAVVAAYCDEAGLPFPDDAEQKMSIHILAVEAWAKTMRRR